MYQLMDLFALPEITLLSNVTEVLFKTSSKKLSSGSMILLTIILKMRMVLQNI